MQLRPYLPQDFAAVSRWVSDERTHALWCAQRFPFPLTQEGFEAALRENGIQRGDCPFTALGETGAPAGFFCLGVSPETGHGMLKFVVTDSSRRGQGIGTAMLRLALKYAFEIAGASSVGLNVFAGNEAAQRCYRKVGFQTQDIAENAFQYQNESWGRCYMTVTRPAPPQI